MENLDIDIDMDGKFYMSTASLVLSDDFCSVDTEAIGVNLKDNLEWQNRGNFLSKIALIR